MKSLILFLAVLISCGPQSSNKTTQNNNLDIFPGRYLAEVSDESEFESRMSASNYSFVKVDENIYEVMIGEDSTSVLEDSTDYFEPVHKITLNKRPIDTKYLSLWGMNNLGQGTRGSIEGKKGADIQAEEAWDLTTGSKDIVVAVIDTGIDYKHPDLRQNMWINKAEKEGLAGVDDDGNGYVDDVHGYSFISDPLHEPHHGVVGHPDPMDDQGHGTHCAGTIGAVGNNRIGVAGVSWNVSLMAIKFLDENGSGSSTDHYRSLKYALDNDVDIISASYGGGGKSRLIMKMLSKLARKGTLFVAAAGNDDSNNDINKSYPASYDYKNILSVAATDNHDRLASFSNFGEATVDIAAPGVSIMSTLPTKLVKSGYGIYSGTSMATPHVAGAAALLLAHDPSLKGNPVAIKERLMKNSDKLPNLIGKVASSGRLNIFRAMTNESKLTVMTEWKEESYSLQTIQNPSDRVIAIYKIEKAGAKALKLYIDQAVVDTSFDKVAIYDKGYNEVFNFGAIDAGFWTPAVTGDTIYLMVSNAVVKTDKSNGPFGNFNTDGVKISKIKFIK